MNMKLTLLAVAILLGGAAGAAFLFARHSAPSDAPPQDGAMTGFKQKTEAAPTPAAAFLDPDGNAADLTRFRGKVTLVNLWATWCSPCIKEMPSIERLKSKHQSDDFAVVTISEDVKGAPAVAAFYAKNGFADASSYLDPDNAVLHAFGLAGLPTTLLLGRDGQELGRFEGPADWDGPDALRLIDWYVGHKG
jgi:thiol-disulfide isomerase/thioredoxin